MNEYANATPEDAAILNSGPGLPPLNDRWRMVADSIAEANRRPITPDGFISGCITHRIRVALSDRAYAMDKHAIY